MSDGEGADRARRRRRVGWPVIALVLALVAAAVYGVWARPWEPANVQVATETMRPGPVSLVLALNGRVVARESVTIRSSVSAFAESVEVAEGARVARGAVLARLDDGIAAAQLEQALAALHAQEVRQRQAEATLERARALGQNSPRSAVEDAELAVAAAANETTRLAAALELAQQQMAQYTIRAPIAGTVLMRGVDAGQLVDPQTQLFTIADTSELLVETDVDELYSSHIAQGLRALLMPVGASRPSAGTVAFAAPAVDSTTGGRRVRIAFDEPLALPVGLTINANVVVDEVPDALSLPRDAIVTEGAQSHVMVLDGGVATRRAVTFNDWPAERVIISEGLAEGDVVILVPDVVTDGTLAVSTRP